MIGALQRLLVLALLVWPAPLGAHDWYPEECCKNAHCHPVDCAEISSDALSYIWHSLHFPRRWSQPSPDGGCHVCVIPQLGINAVWPRCIFLGATS